MILGGVVAGFVLYVVSVVAQAFGRAGFVPPFVAAWFPVVVAAFFGVSFLLYKEDG
jgi:lipopolysaccharide export system permease protein